jgi:hypothetical protein
MFLPTAVWAAKKCVIDFSGKNLANKGVTSVDQRGAVQ